PDFLCEDGGDHFAAGRIGVNEVRRNQAWLTGVPARHGAGSAHGCERVKESAARIRGDTLLDLHDAWNGGHGFNVSTGRAAPPVHRTHHQDRSIRNSAMNAPYGFTKLLFVLMLDERCEVRL